MPIYVIGPAILTQELTSIGINQSLIKPITINQLAGLPNGSVAVIDWPLVRPSIVVSDPGGKVEVNLTSPVIRELINATARGDVIGIYANASDEDVVEFILAYSWARAVNNELVLVGADFREEVPDYLTAYPIIPVSGKEPVIFVVRWVKPRGLIIGPIYANQLTQLIVNIMRPTISLNAVNGVIDTVDPCYAEYQQYNGASNPSPSVYSTNSSTLIWAAPMWTSTSYSGIQAYSDDNGSFYWDTCLDLSNSINEEQLSGYGPTYYLTANVIGYESYFESSTMYDNGGFEVSQVGAIDYYTSYQQYSAGGSNAFIGDQGGGTFGSSSWDPPSTSETASYTVSIGVGLSGSSVSVGISLPAGTSESISGSLNPAKTISFNGWTVEVSNITWAFNIDRSANQQDFPNSFEDVTPAGIYLSNFNPSQQYLAFFNVDFENYAVTASYICDYYAYQTIWTDAQWQISITPQSSTTASITGGTGIYLSPNAPPGSYVSGMSSGVAYTPCPAPH
ncbi:hypothetical protein GCM10007981_06980 [Thermocladium modestius]|uniref:Uncharacterized protein n=1 Tax=Thermocladium modestius TaxID=62609 RepID=A0A830GUZ8_9CREN|nr:hypothetical protein GCM10007981_06980 [Thermocladium modestius]